jgi:hypothetical protein
MITLAVFACYFLIGAVVARYSYRILHRNYAKSELSEQEIGNAAFLTFFLWPLAALFIFMFKPSKQQLREAKAKKTKLNELDTNIANWSAILANPDLKDSHALAAEMLKDYQQERKELKSNG